MKFEEFLQCLKDERFLALTVLVCNKCYFEVTQKHSNMEKTIGFKPHKGDIIKLEMKEKNKQKDLLDQKKRSRNLPVKTEEAIRGTSNEGKMKKNTGYLDRDDEMMYELSSNPRIIQMLEEEEDENDENDGKSSSDDLSGEEDTENENERNAYIKEEGTTRAGTAEVTTFRPVPSMKKNMNPSEEFSSNRNQASTQAVSDQKTSFRLVSGKRDFSKKKIPVTIPVSGIIPDSKRSYPQMKRPMSNIMNSAATTKRYQNDLLPSSRPISSNHQIKRAFSSRVLQKRHPHPLQPNRLMEEDIMPSHSKRLLQLSQRPRYFTQK